MEEIVLKAQRRDVIGKQVKALRREGLLPAVLYGRHQAPVAVSLDLHTASKILPTLTSAHLITIDVDGTRFPSLVRQKQRNPVTGSLIHVDFQVVSMTEKLRAQVPITLEGESQAVKLYSGILVSGQEQLEVECLPRDLPERIVVDISVLQQIGDVIHVRDLAIPSAVTVLTDKDEIVVVVTAQAAEEAVDTAGTGTEPEVIERGKKEEDF